MLFAHLHPVAMLAFFQGTQLNLFERFLTQAVSGIDSTGITSGMQNVAYVVLLVGFLWQVYQSLLHGGDVRGLGTGLIKYVVTALVVMNYGSVFTTINQGFVNAGNWVSNASGGNVLQNWANDLQTQYNQAGFQQMWGLITGSIAGLIDGLLILVAYILYPIVIVIFGFFYIFYGSMITAVQMGQVGQMLNQNDFLGGLGNLEGSFLIGIVSIVYSLAIAVIPFIAKRIVSGEVGSTAAAMIGTAVTALTVGAAGIEGVAAGVASAGAGSSGGAAAGSSSGAATAGSARALTASAGGNQPAPPQQAPIAAYSGSSGAGIQDGSPTLEGHADQIRSSMSDVMSSDGMGSDNSSEEGSGATSVPTASTGSPQGQPAVATARTIAGSRSSAQSRRGPSVHRYNLGTWSAYHAARIAARSVAGAARNED